MLVEALRRYADGTLAPRSQIDVARELGITEAEIAATLTRPLGKEDLIADWARPAREIANLVRSLAPQPLARTTDAQGETLKLAAVHVNRAASRRTTPSRVVPPRPRAPVSYPMPSFSPSTGAWCWPR